MRRTILTALAVLIASASASLAVEKLKVAIPQKGFWDSSWVEFGEAAGFFKEAGLEVEVFYTEGGAQTVATVVSGSVDIAMSNGILGAIGTYVKGGDATPYRIISAEMTGAHELFWWVKADSPIKSLKDADGKTIAFSTNGSSTNSVVLAFIKEFALKAKPMATGNPASTLTAVMTNQVDVGWAAPPFGLKEMDEGKINLVAKATDAKIVAGQTIRVIAVNAETLAKKRDALLRYLQAYRETIDYMYSSDQAIKDYAEFAKIDVTMAKRVRDQFFPKAIVQPDQIKGLDTLLPEAVTLKFIDKPLTKEQLAELFQVPLKK